MSQAFFCPICDAILIAPGRVPIVHFRGGHRDYHLGIIFCCMNCAAITEIDPQSGDLYEFPRQRIVDLTIPDNWQDVRHTPQSLGLSMLYGGKES